LRVPWIQAFGLLLLACAALLVPACQSPLASSTAAPTAGALATGSGPTPAGTSAAAPTATMPSLATAAPTTAPTAAPTLGGTPALGGIAYQDDRSGPDVVMQSYVNAINLKQYVRAYSYWEPSNTLPPYAQFEQGFAGTGSVQLALGPITTGAGAGQVYYSVPAVLTATQTSGATQMSAGCYVLHLARPEIQAAPPFQGLRVQSAKVQAAQPNANANALMTQLCADTAGAAAWTPQSVDPASIDASRYLDDRSDALQVLRSLFNAVNSKQYARAYSYWEPSNLVPPFPQFEQGYANTASVQLTTGAIKSDAVARQVYYAVPVTLKATTTSNTTQTFVGCYTLHIGRPEIQGAPPFQPLAIRSAQVQAAPNDADTTQLMNQSCP